MQTKETPAPVAAGHEGASSINDSIAEYSTATAAVSLFTSEKPQRLSKHFWLDGAGALAKKPGGSLLRGYYERTPAPDPSSLASLVDRLKPNQALAYGQADSERAPVASRAAAREGDITRTRDYFDWPAAPGWMMLDYDPDTSAERLDRDGLLSVLGEAWPGLETAPVVLGDSASSHIWHADADKCLKGRGGLRCYVLVADARDIPRAGQVLHDRLWLAGHGYYLVSKSGALLERGPVDAVVWQPERLDFAAGASCSAPLEQRRPATEPRNNDAPPIDSLASLADLSPAERERLNELRREAREEMAPEQDTAREAWVETRLAEIEPEDVEEARARLRDAVRAGRLYGDFLLHHRDGGTVSVGEVLDDPDRWHGERFADPLEPDYRGDSRIAWLNLKSGGRPYIYSHAHGGARYTLIRASATATPEQVQKAKAPPQIDPETLLPDNPDELLNLPYGLGVIQDWIHGRMKYPSRASAGVGALATLTAFTQGHTVVDSFGGLGVNEQFLVLAPTGFGKEDLRAPISVLSEASGLGDDGFLPGKPPQLQWSAPSSLQGLHALLEEQPAQFFLSDEFAEWLAQTGRDPHKQAALGYFMQLYTKALSTVNAPHAVTNKYKPVRHPRVSVLATSTAERILETMTASHADSGAYNRWVILLAEQGRIDKRYTGLVYEPPKEALELVRHVSVGEIHVLFSDEAWRYFMEHDSQVIEPLKFEDNHLAGRLSEQAIKMAALIAISDYRHEISRCDLQTAYAIREGLYHRVRAMVSHDGGISGMHETGQALEQVRRALRGKDIVYKSQLPAFSRKFKALSLPERQAVLAALYDAGEIEDVEGHRGMIKAEVPVTDPGG